MLKKSKWILLYLVLALLLLFSLFAVPRIAIGAMSETKRANSNCVNGIKLQSVYHPMNTCCIIGTYTGGQQWGMRA